MNHNTEYNNNLIIALTGTICSGKGLVAEILKSKGCTVDTFSSIIREELKIKGIEPLRPALQNEGNRLRAEYGGHILAERLLKKYHNQSTTLVIDGLRNIAELDYLKKNPNFYLIGVDAPLEIRWTRAQKRHRDSDILDYDKFVADDARDRGLNEPLTGQQVGMCLVQADYLLINDEEFTRLEDSKIYKQVDDIYRNILKKQKIN